MNAKLYANLEAKIQEWFDEASSDDAYPETVIFGNDTTSLMAKSACNVFDACVESQAFARQHGFIEEKV